MLGCLICGALGFAVGAVLMGLLMALLYVGRSEED